MKKIRVLILFLLFLIVFAITGISIGASVPESENGSSRIVGGFEAEPGAWPWMAALISANGDLFFDQYCGATLIDPKWVITAAHCVTNAGYIPSPSSIEVVLDVHDLKNDPGDRYQISQIVVHPSYRPETNENDVALLELKRSANYKTIDLIDDSTTVEGLMGTVTGWGFTQPVGKGKSYPERLQQVALPIITNLTCNQAYGGAITSSMLCAGFEQGGKDSCFGDSGGPLMVKIDNQWRLVGIVSWGYGCALAGYYGVYSRVSSALDFVTAYLDTPPSALTVYLPHVTGQSDEWNDYLQADNLAVYDAQFIITLYGNTGNVVYQGLHEVGAMNKAFIDLKALHNGAKCGKITYDEPKLTFRTSQENKTGGGLAENRLTDDLDSSLGFFFTDFSPFFQWKGIALTNFGTANVSVTLTAIGNGRNLASAVVAIGPNRKIVGTHKVWFPNVSFSQLKAISAVSTSPTFNGVAISGDFDNSQLLFTTGAPLQ